MNSANVRNRPNRSTRTRCLIAFSSAIAALSFLPLSVFAIPYLPGQTLNPACLPTDPTCVVATSTFAGNITVAGTASSTNVVVSNTLTIGSLTGILQAVGGAISNALVNLATEVTGILPVANGGTGWASLASGYIPFGNGAGALATSSSLYWDNTDGRLGIGTTTPWARLSVTGPDIAATSPAFVVADANNSPLFSVFDNGSVGIDTTSPIGQLTVTNGTPSIVGSISTNLNTPDAVYVQGRYAYAADRGNSTFDIFDVSNPTSPVALGTLSNGGFNVGVYVQGRYAYLTNQGNGGLDIIDVSNPSAPIQVGNDNFSGPPTENIYVQGRYAYYLTKSVASSGPCSSGTFCIEDISNPASPVAVGSAQDGSGSGGEAVVQGRYAYTLDGSDSELVIFDVSNPAAPVRLSTSSAGLAAGTVRDIYVQGRYAYITAAGGSALVIYDISNPSSPVEVSSITTGLSSPSGIYVQGRYAYVTDRGNDSLVVFDVSNPATPVELRSISVGGNNPDSVYVQGRYAYVTNRGGFLSVIDIGGAYVQSLEAGGLEAGTLVLRSNLQAVDGEFSGGLTVGSNLNVGGSFSLTASTWNATTTAGKSYSIFSLNTASSTSPLFTTLYNGDIGIGTATPYNRLEVWGPDTASTSAFTVVNNASTTEFSVFDTGNATLAGSLIQNSDQRLKTNIQSLDASSSLSLIDELNPVTFNWIDPNKGTTLQLGFIAQQVRQIFPNLISTTSPTALTPDGTLSLNYIGLISPVVSAIQELDQQLTNLANAVSGFADSFTTNQLTFVRGQGTEMDVQKLCIGSTCITETQLDALLTAAGQSGTSAGPTDASSSADTEASSTPPVIQINGDNPAIAQVGATYNDLGATVTGPTVDLNLGIQTFVNGVAMSPVQIDTSAAATDTIDYVATDQSGLTSTSTRIIIIEAATAATSTAQ
jgi:hypothetical protein